LIKERTAAYEQKIEVWQEVNSQQMPAQQAQAGVPLLIECRKQLTRMLYDYNQLQDVLLQNEGLTSDEVTGCGLVSKMLSRISPFWKAAATGFCRARDSEEDAAAAASEEKARRGLTRQ